MKILMIDNYDSFTYNLVHYMEDNPYNVEVVVVEPNALTDRVIEENNIIGIVISPGPSHPKDREDVMRFIRRYWDKMPVLGVCLGHQMLWYMDGGEVSRGSRPVHGYVSEVFHDGSGMFKNLPQPLSVTRYHSLQCYGETEHFIVTARTEEGVNMAVQHKFFPVYGVQYHPEAILSESGQTQLHHFIRIAVEACQ